LNTIVLTESQRGVLQIALEIAVDRFKDHVRMLSGFDIGPHATTGSLADQFERQAVTAQELLNLVACADAITVIEEGD